MSTPLGSSQLLKPRPFYPHTISQSARFDGGSSAVLSRTPGTTGNRRTWTWSGWVKRSTLGTSQNFYTLFSAGPYTGSSTHFAFYYSGSKVDIISFYQYTSGYEIFYETDQLFRDSSAWYHFVVEVDITESTSTDRVKIYLNGTRITSFQTSTAPSSDTLDTYLNWTGATHYVGSSSRASTDNLNGYLAEVNFIDGTALDPTSFGETKSGIWIPKDTSGLTFGTNGYRLKFQDDSAIGDNTGGNTLTPAFTVGGLAATDVVPDSPTNNWCVLNTISSLGTQSEGNLKHVTGVSGFGSAVGSIGVTSGKWYWEVTITSSCAADLIGVVDATYDSLNSASFVGGLNGNSGVDSISYYTTALKFINGTATSYGVSYTTNDIIGVALNLDDNQITFYKNGSSQGAISHTFSGNNILPAASDALGNASATYRFNFGQDSANVSSANADKNGFGTFEYAVPSGFLALCTANLPDPTIDPAKDRTPADHFNTVLYTGNGSTQSITGVGFQPDWLWLKNRTAGNSHALFDSVRGSGSNGFYNLSTNTTNDESDATNVASLDSDGFTLGSNAGTNRNTDSLVSWNWLAGGSAVSNSDGTITSSVSANTKAGFSIVSYTGTGSGATVGHGLSQAPEWILAKQRDADSTDWYIYHSALGASAYITLNGTAKAVTSSSDPWNATAPTNSVFSVSSAASPSSSGTMIAYCFHSVDGYSKVGTYESNNNSNGPFVFTGFKPAFILMKDADRDAMAWTMFDNKRNPLAGNPNDESLTPSGASAEPYDSNSDIDFLSNGFKLRGGSSSWNNYLTETYIYIAFAEQPFKYSNAE
tara:strand:- start:243 stop:2693 length:2451 start_codon:yes stop_codon:yes gene_type:complete